MKLYFINPTDSLSDEADSPLLVHFRPWPSVVLCVVGDGIPPEIHIPQSTIVATYSIDSIISN